MTKPELMPFQQEGVRFLDTHKGALLADEQGLGKTAQAISSATGQTLVISPAFLKLNWQQEIALWAPGASSTIVWKDWPKKETDFVVVNYDIIHRYYRELRAKKWGTTILDEAHYIKNANARRAQYIIGFKPSDPIDGLSGIPSWRRVCLTGTPIMNRPIDLWAILRFIDPARWKDYRQFVERYCGAEFIYRNDGRRTYYTGGATHIQELGDILRSTVMLRRLKKDVLAELPDKRFRSLLIEAKGVHDLIEDERITINNKRDLGRLQKLRLQIGLSKIPVALETIRGLVESGEKVIVFGIHREVIAGILKGVREFTKAVVITGATSAEDRNDAVKAFQTDEKTKVFLGNIQAAGVGLTLTAAAEVIFAELDQNPAPMWQAADRAHRIGQARKVMVTFLVHQGSTDARTARLLTRKSGSIGDFFREDIPFFNDLENTLNGETL